MKVLGRARMLPITPDDCCQRWPLLVAIPFSCLSSCELFVSGARGEKRERTGASLNLLPSTTVAVAPICTHNFLVLGRSSIPTTSLARYPKARRERERDNLQETTWVLGSYVASPNCNSRATGGRSNRNRNRNQRARATFHAGALACDPSAVREFNLAQPRCSRLADLVSLSCAEQSATPVWWLWGPRPIGARAAPPLLAGATRAHLCARARVCARRPAPESHRMMNIRQGTFYTRAASCVRA